MLSQVLDRLDQVLRANVPGGTKVFRDRVDAESLADAPCANVLAHGDAIDPFAREMDRHEAEIEIRFYVRNDAAPTLAAEVLHAAVHAAIVNDAQLAALCESRRLLQASFERHEADQTALIKGARYRFTYLIPQDSL